MKKTLTMVLAFALVFALGVGGTLAWLTDKTDAVVNTFTGSDVDIELAETTGNSYKMVPGATITKNPVATVKADSEACWLFVKVAKSTDKAFDAYMEYTMADGWTLVEGQTDVYYRKVADTNADQTFPVIKNNTITVKSGVTKAMMDELTENNYPKLTVTAYAHQLMKDNTTEFTAKEAWENVNK